MALTNPYCTLAKLTKWFTDQGLYWVSDDNQDEAISTAELENSLEEAILYADRLVDEALDPWMTPAAARSQNNEWLSDRSKDIATYEAASRGGRGVSEEIKLRRDDALSRLEDVRMGNLKVPGLNYPQPVSQEGRSTRVPRAINLTHNLNKRRTGRPWPY